MMWLKTLLAWIATLTQPRWMRTEWDLPAVRHTRIAPVMLHRSWMYLDWMERERGSDAWVQVNAMAWTGVQA